MTGSLSDGDAGVQVRPLTCRSGFAAGTPTTCSSATCPAGAPVLAVNCSRTSAAVAVTGMVTAFPDDGSKSYCRGPATEV